MVLQPGLVRLQPGLVRLQPGVHAVAAWAATVAGTTILQNSQLTSSVFGLVEREGAAWRVAAARAGAARGAAWQPTGLEALPPPHRALLDCATLEFMAELWEVLKRDEPQTAASLLDGGREGAEADDADEGAAAEGRDAMGSGGGGGASGGARAALVGSGTWDMPKVRLTLPLTLTLTLTVTLTLTLTPTLTLTLNPNP